MRRILSIEPKNEFSATIAFPRSGQSSASAVSFTATSSGRKSTWTRPACSRSPPWVFSGNRHGPMRTPEGSFNADDQIRRAQEPRDELGARPGVELERRPDLEQPSVVQHADPVGDLERLFLVVRDEHRRDAELPLDAMDRAPQIHADLRVERAERLIEQQHLRACARARAPGRRAAAGRPRAAPACARRGPRDRRAPRAPRGACGARPLRRRGS